MNRKGMTLIETIISISILSIAGLMLISGIIASIRIMGKASDYKNSSDLLMSFAENQETQDSIYEKTSKMQYNIKDGDDTIVVDTNATSLVHRTNDNLKLTIIDNKKYGRVKDEKSYIKLMNDITKFVTDTDEMIEILKSDKDYWLNEDNTYNDLLFFNKGAPSVWKEMYPQFPTKLLPENIQQTNAMYVKFYYPWDYVTRTESIHDQRLLYLSKNNRQIELGQEWINVIYDFESNHWYYNEQAYEMKYVVGADKPSLYKGSEIVANTYSEFIAHLKNEKNGWKILNINAEFIPGNSNDIWDNVS